MVHWATSPVGEKVGIGPVIEQPRYPVVVVPVELANQHGDNAKRRELAALNQNLQSAIVERFRRMIRNLTVIRVGSALQQQASHLRVVSNAGSSIKHALPLGLGLVILGEEPGVGAGSSIEQRGRRTDEAVRLCAI